jgi:hypothetical protein
MPQPPITAVQARELVRAVPFCAQRTFAAVALAAPVGPVTQSIIVEWDVSEGITDVGQLLTGDYPGILGVAAPLPHATGPWLDAAMWSEDLTDGTNAGLVTVEYAIDRGCAFRQVAAGTAVPSGIFVNISGLRITGRFVRVMFTNPVPNTHELTVDFGVYVRSS